MGYDGRALLQQRSDGVVGTPAERRRLRALEHAVYRPGAAADAATEAAEEELAQLREHLRAEHAALDRAVAASGLLTAQPLTEPAAATETSRSPARAPARARARRPWWRGTRILVAVVAAVAAAAIAGNVVQASAPRSSLEVFTAPADPPDEGRSDFVNQVLLQGVMNAGPVRYLGEQHGVRMFAALVGDTYHNPIDPQEGVCLTGFTGSDRLDSSTTNCALRSDFERLGVAVFFTESPSGGLQTSPAADATVALVWGPTGEGVREVQGAELGWLVASGCGADALSFRLGEGCAR